MDSDDRQQWTPSVMWEKEQILNEQRLDALDFRNSVRGQYIMAQAIYHALKVMKAVTPEFQEVSNIKDMEWIRDELYPFPESVFNSNIGLYPHNAKGTGAIIKYAK